MKTATQKKQKPSQPPPPNKKDGQLDPGTGLIESDFVRMLRERIIGDDPDAPNWPTDLAEDHEEEDAIKQINLASELLFLRCEGEPLPGKIHPARSLPRIIQELLKEVPGWPEEEPPVIPLRFHKDEHAKPPRPLDRRVAFRRYEVACAFNIMMQAWNLFGAAGMKTGSEWPPQKP